MANRYWVNGNGIWDDVVTTNWSTTPGGAGGASVPTLADSVFFDRTGAYNVDIDNIVDCLDLTVSAGTVLFAQGNGQRINVYGNLSIISTTQLGVVGNVIQTRLSATTAKTVTTNGGIIRDLRFDGVGGSWALQDAVTVTGASTLIAGTLDLNGKTFTATSLTTATGTKNITFNGGTIVLTASTTTTFNNAQPTNFTTTAGTGTGTISMTAATAKTFVGGDSTYNCTLNQGGAGALTITGTNTFNNITNTVQPASVLFTAGTTTTFNNFNLSGTVGNLITIGSVTAASHTLSKSSGTVSSNYLSISRSTTTGGATWYAGANSTDGGNNTGWLFSNAPGGAPPRRRQMISCQ